MESSVVFGMINSNNLIIKLYERFPKKSSTDPIQHQPPIHQTAVRYLQMTFIIILLKQD